MMTKEGKEQDQMNANKLHLSLIVALSLALIASLAVGAGSPGAEPPAPNTPLGTAFTYQGRLTDDTGVPIDDTCDFQFTLWDDPDAGSQVGPPVDVGAVVVTKGLFTALLDFGGVFDGTALWLKIAVLCSGDPSYIDLSPRQAVTAAPYALSADKLDGSHAAAFALASHTHSAADITAGTLGTAYYSAYSDLTAEGYLDNNADADLPTRLQADGRYVNEDQANSVTSIMIADGQVAPPLWPRGNQRKVVIAAKTDGHRGHLVGIEGGIGPGAILQDKGLAPDVPYRADHIAVFVGRCATQPGGYLSLGSGLCSG